MSPSDPRGALLTHLDEYLGIRFTPHGQSLDVVVCEGWPHGNCAPSVRLDLPPTWTARLVEEIGVGHLATLVAEEMEVDSATQLESLTIGPDWLRRPALKPVRH